MGVCVCMREYMHACVRGYLAACVSVGAWEGKQQVGERAVVCVCV